MLGWVYCHSKPVPSQIIPCVWIATFCHFICARSSTAIVIEAHVYERIQQPVESNVDKNCNKWAFFVSHITRALNIRPDGNRIKFSESLLKNCSFFFWSLSFAWAWLMIELAFSLINKWLWSISGVSHTAHHNLPVDLTVYHHQKLLYVPHHNSV